MANYYFLNKIIIQPGYYESVVKSAINTNSIIVVDKENIIPKVVEAAKKLDMEKRLHVITIDDYIESIKSKKHGSK